MVPDSGDPSLQTVSDVPSLLCLHLCPQVFCLRVTERSGKGIWWVPIGREEEKTDHSVTCGGQPGNPQQASYVARGQNQEVLLWSGRPVGGGPECLVTLRLCRKSE